MACLVAVLSTNAHHDLNKFFMAGSAGLSGVGGLADLDVKFGRLGGGGLVLQLAGPFPAFVYEVALLLAVAAKLWRDRGDG